MYKKKKAYEMLMMINFVNETKMKYKMKRDEEYW